MKAIKASCCVVFVVLLSLLGVSACQPPVEVEGERALHCLEPDDGGLLNLDCPELPDIPQTAQQPDYDYFAWNSFIALNWPALDPTASNNQRGFPDTSQAFTATRAPGQHGVWETWKEKRELFRPLPDTSNPGPWNQAVNYDNQVQGIASCTGDETLVRRAIDRGLRIIPQVTKTNSLDETVEVPSEALESIPQLCGGTVDCNQPIAQQPDCCRVRGHAVEPRVWRGTPGQATPQPVRYEVKVNYDYYRYIRALRYYLDSVKNDSAKAAAIRLPYRTTAAQGPSKANPYRVLNYAAQACYDSLSTVTPTTDQTPCLSGAIQTKSGWIQLYDPAEYDQYYTSEALYYTSEPVPGTDSLRTCVSAGTFGLVGFHIIQRTHPPLPQPSAPDSAIGGTFIFATWEHTGLDAGYTYSNYLGNTPPLNFPPKKGFYPPLDSQLIPVTALLGANRILPNTQAVNDTVHARIRRRNSNSVWLNYQLVGTQFMPVDSTSTPGGTPPYTPSENDPTGIGQPYYLANLVVETNIGLQRFQGVPPLYTPIANYAGVLRSNPGPGFIRTAHNLSWNRKAFTMGGCMGCHGVAQAPGFSFSFVLQNGQAGAEADTELDFFVPQPGPPTN